ncbi:hypothetical protein SLE2022_155750 [Rubroshorea leprosula]
MTALSLLTPNVKSRSFRTDASHHFQSASIFLDSFFLSPPLNFSGPPLLSSFVPLLRKCRNHKEVKILNSFEYEFFEFQHCMLAVSD